MLHRAVFVVALALSAALVLAPSTASAEEDDLERIEMARETYAEGAAQYKVGQYAAAEASFRRVYDLMHTPGVLFDIALAQEKQRRWGDAASSFEAFLRSSQRVGDRVELEARIVELRRLAGSRPGTNVPRLHGAELALGSGEQAAPAVTVTRPAAASAPPAPAPAPATSTSPPATAPSTATAAPPAATTATTAESGGGAAATKGSRWWIWAVVGGVVAVGAGVGLGVALSHPSASPVDISIGPGYSQGLVTF